MYNMTISTTPFTVNVIVVCMLVVP